MQNVLMGNPVNSLLDDSDIYTIKIYHISPNQSFTTYRTVCIRFHPFINADFVKDMHWVTFKLHYFMISIEGVQTDNAILKIS